MAVTKRDEADGCIYQAAAHQARRYLRELDGQEVVPGDLWVSPRNPSETRPAASVFTLSSPNRLLAPHLPPVTFPPPPS